VRKSRNPLYESVRIESEHLGLKWERPIQGLTLLLQESLLHGQGSTGGRHAPPSLNLHDPNAVLVVRRLERQEVGLFFSPC
jgi:hypothetical protein